jgi:hypothetical protein
MVDLKKIKEIARRGNKDWRPATPAEVAQCRIDEALWNDSLWDLVQPGDFELVEREKPK